MFYGYDCYRSVMRARKMTKIKRICQLEHSVSFFIEFFLVGTQTLFKYVGFSYLFLITNIFGRLASSRCVCHNSKKQNNFLSHLSLIHLVHFISLYFTCFLSIHFHFLHRRLWFLFDNFFPCIFEYELLTFCFDFYLQEKILF